MKNDPPKGWYSRGYLPHFDNQRITQSITFRLVDSYPKELVTRTCTELDRSELTTGQRDLEWRKQAQTILDKGYGACWLGNPPIARLVQDALRYFDGTRYHLHAWCVMPNHVHVLITQCSGHSLAAILHSWQSFSANKANSILGRSGHFWARGYFDRFIRNGQHFAAAVDYIEQNPVSAKLCARAEDWPFGSAFFRRSKAMKGPGRSQPNHRDAGDRPVVSVWR